MNIILQRESPDQDPPTLEEIFKQVGAEGMPDTCKEYATMMLQLLAYLEQQGDEPNLYVSTGHQYVTLQNHHKRERGEAVQVHTWAGQYVIRYRWRTATRPWPDADVETRTSDVAEAVALILTVLHPPLPPHPERPPRRQGPSPSAEALETYYTRLGQHPEIFPPECVQAMVSLIRYLAEWGIGADLWVYPSHEKLCVTDIDAAVGVVEVTATPAWYVISYPASPPGVLWNHARVIGRANYVTAAAHMIERAIQRTFKTRT